MIADSRSARSRALRELRALVRDPGVVLLAAMFTVALAGLMVVVLLGAS